MREIVKSLVERDAPIVGHFSRPEIQYVGSTSGCGCEFPHLTLTRSEWIGYVESEVNDPECEANERVNRHALVDLLRASGESVVELYGIWLNNDEDFEKPVNVREDIQLARILEPDFRFKERASIE